jgi:serine/threonine protein kinase
VILAQIKDSQKNLMGAVTIPKQKLHEQISVFKNFNDPNIIEYCDSFESGDNICLVMEYVEVINLNELLK